VSTLAFLFLLVSLLGIAAAVFAVLTDRLIEHWRDADLQDRINRARWPSKGA
jgi:hypothetical protein